ncbi:MAG: M20/M25/M40 family metallo-hydrolase [Muribaculaceae bacterium]|nr:M20/M25/M40 family metallo-hydrolase [Muribaculaceae bacterium]
MEIKDLKPELIWKCFDEVTKVPRPSCHEEKIREFLLNFAKENGIDVKTDEVGNVVMSKAATPGHEGAPTVILQAHMDMVCEKNKDVEHDFMKDPIKTYIDGDWVRAKGTTLGADNGIGVAAAMAVMLDKELVHGPIEALFTVNEEIGLESAESR